MSSKRQRKAERRKGRRRKKTSRTKAPQHAEVGNSDRALPHPDSVKLSDLFAMPAANERGPGEEPAYDYCASDHGWFVVPRAGEPFDLPLTGELESGWGVLAEQDPACAPVVERIRALRAAGCTHDSPAKSSGPQRRRTISGRSGVAARTTSAPPAASRMNG